VIVNVRPPDSRLPQALHELLEDDDKFGFLVMDGNGCLFGTLQGNNREILHKFTVDLPKKHGRGGQSALRFARLRLEKRHNYVRKVAELAVQFFITENKPNVAGIVLAGSADFKTELSTSDMFDPRLLRAVIKTVDVSYGAEPGFNQAIELSAETLGSVKLVQEKRLIQKYFDEISQDTGRYCFSVSDTLKGLELGAVETLIVWENLDVSRITVRNNSSGETKILHLSKVRQPHALSSRRGMPAVIQPHQISLGSHAKCSSLPRRNALASQEQEKNESYFRDPETGVELEVSQL
jgi:peptide chain release factor subunit 1